MTLDPSIPTHLVESLGATAEDYEPRASLLEVPLLASLRTQLWMGGVHTTMGDPVVDLHVRQAWVVDCAGEMPSWLALQAGRYIPRVFSDIEEVPGNMARITALVEEIAEAVSSVHAPERMYLMCKQGLNRSGLVSALVLRELGVPSLEAVAVIRAARPGALNNVTFEQLVRGTG